ncbi:MAG TPA: sulfotransferase [Thermoanaerobaculia bacterium]|nr:sulfotransferase [Thermoanaerobaculia bacterium]
MTLPNFLIIGAAKAGTTSLYEYLAQHPDVYMSPIKETNHFCDEEQIDIPAVRSREAYERLFAAVNGERAIGEASPKYLNTIRGLERIDSDLPGVRLIVSLRNPVDRAYSSYLGLCRDGRELRAPEDALRPGGYSFETSFYAPRLRRYFDRFPRERIKVILFDDLVARPAETMREIFRFLDVDPSFAVDTTVRHNPAVVPRFPRLNRAITGGLRLVRPLMPQRLLWRDYGTRLRRAILRTPDPLSPALRARLLEQYRDDIRATGDLIGRDLSQWLA